MKRILKPIKLFLKKISKNSNHIINVISVGVAVASLLISYNAINVSEIALEITSKGTEPIIEMDIDYGNEILKIRNRSHKYYQISSVNYGKIRFIGIMDSYGDNSKINYAYIPEKYTGMKLEHGHTVGTDMSDNDIKTFNKKLNLSLSDTIQNESDRVNAIENTIKDLCESKGYLYWEVSPNYTYYYIEINFKDIYGHRDSLYYMYKYEYGSTWQLYKVGKDEYIKYMNDVYQNTNEDYIISNLFDEDSFEVFDNTIFKDFYYDSYFPMYQKYGIQ